jgi:hypothetical protein
VLDPIEVSQLMPDAHLPSLTEDDQRLIAARVTGWSVERIAARTFRSERAVRDHLNSVLDRVCAPLGVQRDVAVLGWWFGVHSGCNRRCATTALEMIRTGAVFPAETPAETA